MAAVVSSLQRHGFSLVPNAPAADIAVIWSVLWAGRMAANRTVYEQFRNTKRPVICIEVGTLKRGITWKIALNHVTAQGYYGHRDNLDLDRPRKLNIALSSATINHGKILVAGQHNQSLQLQHIDQAAWLVEQIHKTAAGRKVVVRSHPRCALNRKDFPKDVVWQQPKKIVNSYDSFDIDWNYDAVINYNSGPGIQAVIAGIPVVVDATSLAYGVEDRSQWLIEICHTEYTVEEIESGTWLKRIGLVN